MEHLSREDAAFLKAQGWERRGMHGSHLTDRWAHPSHSVRTVRLPIEFDERPEPQGWDAPPLDPPRGEQVLSGWVWFTREEALTLEGRFTPNVVFRMGKH